MVLKQAVHILAVSGITVRDVWIPRDISHTCDRDIAEAEKNASANEHEKALVKLLAQN